MSPHGTLSRYTNGGCRCDDCRAAKREYARGYYGRNFTASRRRHETYNRRLQQRVRAADPTVTHGVISTYVNGLCRCDDCRAVMAERARDRRRREAS